MTRPGLSRAEHRYRWHWSEVNAKPFRPEDVATNPDHPWNGRGWFAMTNAVLWEPFKPEFMRHKVQTAYVQAMLNKDGRTL